MLFVCLSETWLKSHLDAELNIEGYTLFRCDSTRKKRSRGRHTGGVGVYVRKDIGCSCEIIFSYASDCIQLICLYSKVENLAIVTIYRQPDDSYHGHPSKPADFKIPLNRVKNVLLSINPSPDIIFGGDFNLPHASWPSGLPTVGATTDEKLMLNQLNELCNDLFMTQLVSGSTHKDGNTLDLVFVNNSSLVNDCLTIPVLLSTSHHQIVQLSTTYKVNPVPVTSEERPELTSFNKLNFFSKDTNWDALLQEMMELDWVNQFNNLGPEEILENFYANCYSICSKYVPERTRKDDKKNSKVFRYRRSLTKRRRRIVKRLLKVTSPATRSRLSDELLQIEKDLQKSYKNSHAFAEEKAIKAIKANPKFFFAYVKKKAKVKAKVGPLLGLDGKLTANNKEMAEILAQQYTKVFSKPETDVPQHESDRRLKSILSDIKFDTIDMIKSIDELKENSAAGPDGFPAILLKKCKSALASPLTLLWRKCIKESTVPANLKQSLITPIHKGDSRSTPANYRPVALTSHIIKIFEKILRKHIVEHMDKNDLFNPNQHGFRSGRSCLSQLLEQYDEILNILDTGDNADVVYLDFAKAFDKVDHAIVLNKIKQLGISGSVYNWLESFLTNRFQTVMVDGVKSIQHPVVSGVPQGSVLGPLIFLILIGDIDADTENASIKSFADDTRATKAMKTILDAILLQMDLDKIYDWTRNSNMMLNDVKFELLRYGPDPALKESIYTTPTGEPITTKNEVKDLGVIMSDDCLFQKQIDRMIEKAKNTISWIFRSFQTRNKNAMLTLYKSLIIPILEYCSVLWCPLKVGLIQKLEAIQWSYLRKVSSTRDYWECLKESKMYSLQRRRERYRIIYVWKILEQMVPNINNKLTVKINARSGRLCAIPAARGNNKFSKIYEASFPVHGAKLFNALPKHLRDMQNVPLEKFKRALDKYISSIPDEPQLPGYTACRRAISNSIIDMQKTISSVGVPNSLQVANSGGWKNNLLT